MQKTTKIILAVAIAALIVVIALIAVTKRQETSPASAGTPEPAATAEPTPEPTQTPEPTEAPEATDAPEDGAQTGASGTADGDDGLYEGALAGLTEEEIGEMALSEEGAGAEGAEEGVD